MIIGKRIKQLREELGLTQEELADRVKISRSALANYESGLREPKGDILIRFAEALNTTTDYLLGKKGNTNRPNKIPPDIRKIARAGEKMTPEQRERLLKVAQVLFPEAFKEE